MAFTTVVTPVITICVPMTASIRPISRVTILRPLFPINARIFELKIKQKKVIRHKTANTDTVIMIPAVNSNLCNLCTKVYITRVVLITCILILNLLQYCQIHCQCGKIELRSVINTINRFNTIEYKLRYRTKCSIPEIVRIGISGVYFA